MVVPLYPSHFSALGMLLADERHDFIRTFYSDLTGADFATLLAIQHEMVAEATASLRHAEGAAQIAVPALVSAALAKTNLGDLQGLVNQLQQGGLGNQVQSWLGNGTNLPVSPDQLRAALGSDQVRQMAEHFGVSPDAALKLLSEHLPGVIDKASPSGALPSS